MADATRLIVSPRSHGRPRRTNQSLDPLGCSADRAHCRQRHSAHTGACSHQHCRRRHHDELPASCVAAAGASGAAAAARGGRGALRLPRDAKTIDGAPGACGYSEARRELRARRRGPTRSGWRSAWCR
eukprot:4731867-Prymnesium_polylepis.1